MREFPTNETGRIRLKAIVCPIFVAVASTQPEDSIVSFIVVVKFIFGDICTTLQTSAPLSSSYSNCSNAVRLRALIKYFIPHAVSLETAVLNKERKYIAKLMCEAAVVKKLLSIKELKKRVDSNATCSKQKFKQVCQRNFDYMLINYTL